MCRPTGLPVKFYFYHNCLPLTPLPLIRPLSLPPAFVPHSSTASPAISTQARLSGEPGNYHIIDVFFLPGVTDTLAESVLAGARMLGIPGLEHVETGRRYMLDSDLSEEDVRTIAGALLYNPVIQQYILHAAGENKNAGASSNAQFIAPKFTSEETQN